MTSQQLSPVVEKALQQTPIDLIDLGLLDKQAHWNIKDSRFRTLHPQLDETVGEVRVASDDVVERLATLGGVPDAHATTVTITSSLKRFDISYLGVDEVYSQFEGLLMTISNRIKATLDPVDDIDHLSNDMFIGIVTGLGKQAWILRSATANG